MLTTKNIRSATILIVRLSLGFTFLLSGLAKIQRPYDFLASVYKYQLTGPLLTKSVAMVLLPWIETVVGASLLGGALIGGSLMITAILGVMFAYVQMSAVTRHLAITCGCFGSLWSTDLVNFTSVVRSSIIVAAAGGAYLAWLGEMNVAAKQKLGDR